MLTENEAEVVRMIVCNALAAAVEAREYVPAAPEYPGLRACCGCFVTYKTHGQLRGCLGCFTSETPLYLTVAAYARYSLTEDPRFAGNRLTAAELPEVTFDVSVLSPLAPCNEPENIELGRHGIYVRGPGRSGCFLPQVAAETGWTLEEFWGNCCAGKAGLPYDFWKSPAAELFTFEAEVVEGKFNA